MVGERLTELRRDAGLTQDELGRILCINKHSISSYERGKSEPPDAIKIAIARYFHVSVDYLLGVTDDPRPYDERPEPLMLSPRLPDTALQSLRDYADFLTFQYTD